MRPMVTDSRWPVTTAVTGTILIGCAAFWLSFTALADLAVRSGVSPNQAWTWPLLVDGLIVVATVAVVALDGQPTAWYPWSLLIGASAMSVCANAAHAMITPEITVPRVLAAAVASVPPLVLLASTHLTVVLIRSSRPIRSETAHRVSPEMPVSQIPPGPQGSHLTPVVEASTPSPQKAVPTTASSDAEENETGLAGKGPAGGSQRARALRADGLTNAAIARQLEVHPSTVGRWLAREPPAHLADDTEEPATAMSKETR